MQDTAIKHWIKPAPCLQWVARRDCCLMQHTATQQVIYALIHSFNKYLSSITGTVWVPGDTEVREIGKIAAFRTYNVVGRDNKQMNISYSCDSSCYKNNTMG